MNRATIVHPELGEKEIFPSERTLAHYAVTGWTLKAGSGGDAGQTAEEAEGLAGRARKPSKPNEE